MAEANFKPIKKISVEKMEVKPNLDLEESYKDFDWESLYKQLDWLPGGGLNKAHEAIDRHANGDKRDKIAMIWEGKNGEREDYTF
ncbi:MAG: acetate--CoA ligase, partial [SAR202 cluster bacterium]|nr:acetate--CoA ligase [SAR202 cluster bacterium]